jgi:fumarate hydratase class II
MGQSSNDTFPTAMHIAAYTMATEKTIPALKPLRDATERGPAKAQEVGAAVGTPSTAAPEVPNGEMWWSSPGVGRSSW